VAVGGVDTLTNTPFASIVFSAPAGATVVTPLTTLIRELTQSGLSVDEAESTLSAALGLTLAEGESLLHFDSIANIDTSAGAQVENASEMVLNTLHAMQSILIGAGIPAATAAQAPLAALASAIAEAAEQGESFDLADVDAVERLLDAALS